MATLILFFLIFGFLVISHEMGHFLIGKKNGIKVNEFCVGMGPTIFHFQKGETKYALRLLPFGGACVFDGEDGGISGEKKTDDLIDFSDEMKGKMGEGIAFPEANVWKRIATVVAGPLFNFLFAFLFSLIVVGFSGTDRPVIQEIMENSAAQEAGLMKGDLITHLNGERIHLYREVSLNSAMNAAGEPIEITYERDGVRDTVLIVPKFSEEDNRYYIGLIGGGSYEKANPLTIFQYGFYEVSYWAKYTFKSLGMLVSGEVSVDSLSGPVGIADFVGDTYEEVKPYGTLSVVLTMLNLTILLSVNLGILNLLPLPALDGGRLVFLLIEVVRGKPLPPEKEGMVHMAGMICFMLLMFFVMYHDIMRLFQ